ncbi:hypothetical protein [Novipirellula artificiosorum]|uniref:Uncharacterized protein n=1 Tax=Novipirellula artificiosorum TaxID=2528016 RepID=A0A5C6DTJ9_9BACT|nr:hypothetical protein [Novipirellula artificiosorum]TWU39524.1 hypothetical protein Poly41_23790 [Novipirellula artificiosorum]
MQKRRFLPFQMRLERLLLDAKVREIGGMSNPDLDPTALEIRSMFAVLL